MIPRQIVVERSGGHCEAMILVRDIWARCGKRPIEVHHALTRARGGALLDEVGETSHLMALCHEHHRMADGGAAYEGELLIDGYVEHVNGRVVYHGSDHDLRAKYPE